VAYHERQNYLLEADLSASLHLDHVETRFAFRTRLLDCLWTGLPVIATRGDVMAETLAEHGLAFLVEPQDVTGVARTILELLERPDLRRDCMARAAALAPAYHWRAVTRPLVEFCANPRLASDKAYLGAKGDSTETQSRWHEIPAKAWRALRMGGPASLVRQGSEYLRWKLGK
jgi:hypothetical protein